MKPEPPETPAKTSSDPEGCATSLCCAFSVWRIVTIRWNHDRTKGDESNEYIAAQTIEDVWEYLRYDRADEGVEIRAIVKEAPLTKIFFTHND